MAAEYIVSKMSTVLVVPVDGIDLSSPEEQAKINLKVEAKVKEIVNKLKITHSKFEDPDFGPTEKDEYGAISLYGNGTPNPAGSKYPAPESLKWERPQYDDGKFSSQPEEIDVEDEGDDEDDEFGGFLSSNDDDEIWCKHGKLFLDGSSSGDVIQGQLGDCWFLSALAVMGAHENLLDTCFWKRDSFREHGVYVLRFYKDCNVVFVIIDDRIPVKVKDGRVIFAGNKDPNELWVPLIEKGYAKLHGCYKALIGGFTHNGLADMTGFCPRLIVMREGYLGYSEKYSSEEIWQMLRRYKSWNCLMGCSIQANPKETAKVEADAGNGLHMGHAYSLLDVGEIDLANGQKERLVKVRNPWGRGEWEGRYGDRSEERVANEAQIDRVFNKTVAVQEQVDVNFNDGTFFMTFSDWALHFTSLFVALSFPPSEWSGKRTQGLWRSESGGNREMGSWVSNPKIKLRIERDPGSSDEYRQVFVGIYIKDSRLTLGFDYYKDPLYATPLTFDIVTEAELTQPDPKKREFVPGGLRDLRDPKSAVKQPPYNFGTTQIEAFLKVETDYYIVPSLYKRNQAGTFFLNVFVNAQKFHLDGSRSLLSGEQKPMVVGTSDKVVPLKMSVAQFYEKKEMIRERIVSEAKRLGLSLGQIEKLFNDVKEKLSHGAFKRRMLDMGFALADFPDDDLVILDTNNDGTISHSEFLTFFREGLTFSEANTQIALPTPVAPLDDLLYKAVDLEGELTVNVSCARYVREATTWFNSTSATAAATASGTKPAGDDSAASSEGLKSRRYVKYDPAAAAAWHAKNAKERAALIHKKLQDVAAERKAALAPVQLAVEANEEGEGLDGGDLFSPDFSPNKKLNASNLRSFDMTPGKSLLSRQQHDAVSVTSAMSVSLREATRKAGMEAASKLHSDPLLQKAEISRTKSLGALRGHKQNKVSLEGSKGPAEEGTLRKKSKPVDKGRRRNILRDAETMQFLSYTPPSLLGSTPLRAVASFDGNQTIGLGASFAANDSSPMAEAALAAKTLVSAAGSLTVQKDRIPGALTSASPAKLAKSMTLRDLRANPDPTKVAKSSSGVAGRYREVVVDLWDHLIDCVITISLSRPKNRNTEMNNSLLGFKRRQITADSFLIFNPIKSPLPAPTAAITPMRAANGHAPTPKNLRKTPGTASVTTAQAASKQKSAVLEARDRLGTVFEQQQSSYEEVFRRLVLVPATSSAELEGDAAGANSALAIDSNAYLKSLFKKFDKNLNGSISKDEFQQAMAELNIEVSAEDCNIFFNRFGDSRKVAGGIDWVEFLHFFNSNVIGTTNTAASKAPSGSGGASNLVNVLGTLKKHLSVDISSMVQHRVASLETFLQLRHSHEGEQSNLKPPLSARTAAKPFVLPDNAIFQNLSVAQAKTNAEILRKLGVSVSEEEMARISRIFMHNVSLLMTFLRLPELDLHGILDLADSELIRGIGLRSGLQCGGGLKDHTSSVAKLWTGIAPNTDSLVPFDDIASYLSVMLCDGLLAKSPPSAAETKLSPRLSAAATNVERPQTGSLTEQSHAKPHIMGVSANILCRIVADALIYSVWNRSPGVINGAEAVLSGAGGGGAVRLASSLSFSGLDAYIRNERMNFIDRKLKYLMQLEANYSSPATYLLVHVYLSKAHDELILLGHDTVSGEVFKLNIREDLSALPSGEKLRALFLHLKQHEDFANKVGGVLGSRIFNSDSAYLYNPWDTPAEDAVVMELVSRLKIVRGRSVPSALMIAEEPKFIAQLKTLLDAASLPFFSVLSDLTLNFSVDEQALARKTGPPASIRSFVFGSIRNQKTLHTFLVNVSSSLNVVLSTYNNDKKEALRWHEMLAHLTNYRNPFVTVQLLPRFVTPEKYVYQPEEDSSAFTGEEVADPLAVQTGPVDQDGAPHPVWNTSFHFKFQPPKLTNCKVLCTEIAKMKVGETLKYVIVMVRESKKCVDGAKDKQNFRFLTIYDPRSATEYQCGVKPACDLYTCLFKSSGESFERFMECVSDAADTNKLILGPAITPHVVINIYNRNGAAEELLGSCQVSISSVLSGSGVSDKQWVTMTHRVDGLTGSNRSLDVKAGDVELELGFRKQAEIDAQKESVRRHQEKMLDNAAKGDETLDAGVDEKRKTVTTKKPNEKDNRDSQIRELTSQNELLKAEYSKLRDQLAVPSTSNATEVPTTKAAEPVLVAPAVVDEKLMVQLKEAREAAKRLADEKAEMEMEVKRLKESAAKPVVAPAAVSIKKADEELAIKHRKLAEEHEVLLAEAQKLREFQAKVTKEAALSATDALQTNSQPHPLSVSVSASGLADIPNDGSVISILTILQARHERKGAVGSPLDGFQRLLMSYSKGDGQATAKDLMSALSDLLIEVSTEQCMKIMRVVGMSNKGTVLASSVLDHFRSELAVLPKPSTKRPISGRLGETINSVDDGLLSRATAPESFSADDKGGKGAKHRPSSAKAVVTKPAQPLSSTLRSVSSANVTRDSGSTQQPDKEAANHLPAATAPSAAPEEVDWLTVPLPPGWERRLHSANNRHYYAHHETKATQWRHPLDRSRRQKDPQDNQQRNDGREKLNKTADHSDSRKNKEKSRRNGAAVDKQELAHTQPLPKSPSTAATASKSEERGEEESDEEGRPASKGPDDVM